MNRTDAILGIFFLFFSVIGLIFIVPRETISFGYGEGLSPAFFPNVILTVLCGLSILLTGINVIKLRKDKSKHVIDVKEIVKFLWVCLMTAGSVLGLYYLGFLVAAPLIIAAAMLFMGGRTWRLILIVCTTCPIVIYLIFKILLEKPLPVGLLFS